MVGENANKFPELVDQIIAEGHSIGNHTQNHLSGWGASTEDYVNDVHLCSDSLPSTNLFRPPYGRINRNAVPLLAKYTIVMWDILSIDYKPNVNVSRRLRIMKKLTRPGSIIVFHDSEKAFDNLKLMFVDYLSFLSDEGYNSKAL